MYSRRAKEKNRKNRKNRKFSHALQLIFATFAADESPILLDGSALRSRQRSVIRLQKAEITKEYLTRNFFEANDNKLGTLFVDKDNTGTFTDRNTIIYGHNMKNGTMFAQLLKYKEQDFFENNPYFSIYTPDGKESKYQIFVAGVVEDTAVNYQFAFQIG
mgnify:CR=1 FL=1